jgi:hypothetical protein
MASDLSPSPETALIEAYVRLLASGINEVSCGRRLDSGYDLWLQLEPNSRIKQVVITNAEYKADQWKDKVQSALEEINI